MPKGILARLIVKLNSDIDNNQYWRHGVLLSYENTKAIIKEKYFESKITIELTGENKREYLFSIRKAINEIHSDFNKIKVNEMVPCICNHCKNVETPSFYEYDLLRRYELKLIHNIRCPLSLEEVNVFHITSDITKTRLTEEQVIICENKNADLLRVLEFNNVKFFPEKDSASVFIKVKTMPDKYGLRDRDFLLDCEIEKIGKNYPNYFILRYYCFENYLYHPDNLAELNLAGFSKQDYVQEILRQKNEKKYYIISIYKKARDSYQEFRIEAENLRSKANENDIIKFLDSDDLEIYFKSFSMKDHFDKTCINKYNLKPSELVATNWFKTKISELLNLNYS